MTNHDRQEGFSLVIVLMMVGLLGALCASLSIRMRYDTLGQAASFAAVRNLAAAEGGINQATAQFRDIFAPATFRTAARLATPATMRCKRRASAHRWSATS
jgi:type II secretory pathway pseudopilin PulG